MATSKTRHDRHWNMKLELCTRCYRTKQEIIERPHIQCAPPISKRRVKIIHSRQDADRILAARQRSLRKD